MKHTSTPNSSAHKVSGYLNINEPNIIYQEDAPLDLKVVSWPDGKDFDGNDFLKYYAYDRRGGQSSALYIIDEGINSQHEVSTLQRRQ